MLFLLLQVAWLEVTAQQQNYSGTFQVTTGGISLTLIMSQDQFNGLTGSLQSSNGTRYSLQGMVNEGIAAGVVSGSEGSLFFEAFLDGNDLTLSLIEPDQFNMPDYDAAKYLVLSRGTRAPGPSDTPAQPQPAPQQQSPMAPPPGQSDPPGPEGELVSDPVNGYAFTRPVGWLHRQDEGQILLGSNSVPGLISVFPHQAGNMEEMRALMNQGIREEGVMLAPEGAMQPLASQMLKGYYQGSIQGEQARGYGIGILSPHGGGIFVLAVSTPEQLGQEIMAAAGYLAAHTRFTGRSTGDAELVRHFSGEWMWTNGTRTTWMSFFPDGTYSDQSEASYAGNMSDGSGNITGNWGVAGQQSNRGRWSIQGNLEAGVISVINPDGSQARYEYRVFVERGQKYYREYLFNGVHYGKQKNF